MSQENLKTMIISSNEQTKRTAGGVIHNHQSSYMNLNNYINNETDILTI